MIDPTQLDNPITNDGFTMRDLVVAMGSDNNDQTDDSDAALDAPLQAATILKPDESTLKELQLEVNSLEKDVEEAENPTSVETVRKRKLLEQKRARLAKGKSQLAAALNAIDRANLAKNYVKRGPSQVCDSVFYYLM